MLTSKSYTKASASVLILLFVAGLLVGGLAIYFVYRNNSSLNSQLTDLQTRISALEGSQNVTYQSITIMGENGTSTVDIYSNVRNSVVLVQGTTSDGGVQGSGFVYNFGGRNVVLTNYHVVQDVTKDLTITFANGHAYTATRLGTDPYADLAVVSVNAPDSEFKPLQIVSSSTLREGDQVIAIGNPYGLVGSLTTGVVSALGRTIQEETTGSFSIANIIQASTPINPGNSGGPLLNAVGNVVGITTAIVTDSQGLGFAIPSNTILREISALINTGSYHGHSYLGVHGQDMTYALSQQYGTSVTYGWRLEDIVSGGPSEGKLNVGDIVIGMGNKTIKNNDDLASYLEEHTLPGDNLDMTVLRNNQQVSVTVTLGTRPAPT